MHFYPLYSHSPYFHVYAIFLHLCTKNCMLKVIIGTYKLEKYFYYIKLSTFSTNTPNTPNIITKYVKCLCIEHMWHFALLLLLVDPLFFFMPDWNNMFYICFSTCIVPSTYILCICSYIIAFFFLSFFVTMIFPTYKQLILRSTNHFIHPVTT